MMFGNIPGPRGTRRKFVSTLNPETGEIVRQYEDPDPNLPFFVMPGGGAVDQSEFNDICEHMKNRPERRIDAGRRRWTGEEYVNLLKTMAEWRLMMAKGQKSFVMQGRKE